MRIWIALASVCLLSSACIVHEHEDDLLDRQRTSTGTTTSGGSDQCLVAATPGGDGGLGGLLSIRSSAAATVDGVVSVEGGAAGDAGGFDQGPEPNVSLTGVVGTVEQVEDASYSFDTTLITPGSVFQIGVPGEDDTIISSGSDTAPSIAVERFELGPDAVVMLSRYPTIIAQQLIIAEGAQLILRDEGNVSVSVNATETMGAAGATTTIIAQQIIVDGQLEAAGSNGDIGENGGNGGQLQIRSETLSVGILGSISVAGGDGGAGAPEQLCTDPGGV
jgi:hypothetical protein